MGKIYTGASMSLDGYIAGPQGSGFEFLFDWYGNGDVEVLTTTPQWTLNLTQPSAEHWRNNVARTGAIIVGRKLFDSTNGWGGKHPIGAPVVVLSHSVPKGWPQEDADYHVVHDFDTAIATAKQLAGDKVVGVNAGSIAQQCLNARLLDEVWIDLVPVASSKHMWERRSAMVATAYFIRQNDLDDAFTIAEILLNDGDDLIHKAVGWMLRFTGDKDRPRLLKFLDKHAREMPRVMLRYSIEKLGKDQRKHYLNLKSSG